MKQLKIEELEILGPFWKLKIILRIIIITNTSLMAIEMKTYQ